MIFKHIDEIEHLAKAPPKQPEGNLNVGAAEGIGSHLVPKVLNGFLRAYPKVYPHITIGAASELLQALRNGKSDLVLLFHSPNLSDELELRATIAVPYNLVVASSQQRSKEVCSSFIGSREVDDLANKHYPTLKKLQAKYPSASIKISTNSMTAHLQMVLDGLGVSILPEYLVKPAIKAKKLTCLFPQEDFVFNLKVVCRRDEVLSVLSERFIGALRQELQPT